MRLIGKQGRWIAAAVLAITEAAAQPALEEVIVTAQKKAESLQDTPISIAAFGSQALETKGIHNLTDLRNNVPNLQLTPHPNSATTTRLFIRGVGNNDDQITQDPSVAIYIDGVYLARSQGLAQEVADIERIEVLRGPQGTLYGRNATGGAINIVTRPPGIGEFALTQELGIGKRNYYRAKTSVNLPVGEHFAARLGYLTTGQDGFVDNIGTGVDRFGDRDRQAWRADLLWAPRDDLDIRYGYDRSQIDDTPQFIARVPLHPAMGDRPRRGSRFVEDLKADDVAIDGHSLTVTWRATERLDVKYIGAYRELDAFTYQDYHSGERGPHASIITEFDGPQQDQISHELQFLGDAFDGRLEYIAGLYWFKERADSFDTTMLPNFPIDLTGDGMPDAVADVFVFRDTEIENRAQALFAQTTYTPDWLESRLHITLGARASKDERKAVLNNTTELRDIQPTTPLPFPSPANLTIEDPEGRGDRDFSDISPSLVVNYDFGAATDAYFKIVKGYKTGGYNVRASSVERFERGFDEETLISREIGVKTELWNRRLRINTAIFQADYDDIQVNMQTDPSNPSVTDVLNAGEAVIEGAELDVTAVLSDALTLNLTYGYLDPDYEEIRDTDGNNIKDQFRFVEAPPHSATADLQYVRPLGFGELSVDIGYTWQDAKVARSTADTGKYIIDEYGLWNARAGLSEIAAPGGTLRLAVWGRNLADEEYYTSHFDALLPSAFFGEPRTYGLDVVYEY